MHKFMLIILCCLLLSGCVFTTTLPQEQLLPKPMENITEPAPIPVTIYCGSENADGFETIKTTVPELTPHALVDKLIGAGVLTEKTAILSAEVEGTHIHLDLNAAFGDQVSAMGTAGERMIIGSLVNTFLTAYHAETLSFTVEGQILESGHVIYDFELTFFQ